MPFLDSESKVDEAVKMANSVGVDLIVLEADKSIIKKRILEEGYPHRGFRWCTFQKIKPIRHFKKKHNIHYEVINDRAFETFKRLMSLAEYAKQKIFMSGKKFRPIFPLTFLDVLKINRDFKLIHKNYLEGYTRVSCTLCPYRTILEIDYDEVNSIKEVPHSFQILQDEYSRFYADLVDFDYFVKYGIWRYGEYQTKEILALRRFLLEKASQWETITRETVLEYIRSPWTAPLPRAREITLDEMLNLIFKAYSESFLGIYFL